MSQRDTCRSGLGAFEPVGGQRSGFDSWQELFHTDPLVRFKAFSDTGQRWAPKRPSAEIFDVVSPVRPALNETDNYRREAPVTDSYRYNQTMGHMLALLRHYRGLIKRTIRLAFPNNATVHRMTGSTSFAAHNLDDRIRPLLAGSPKWYVEAGANDGVNQSNTKALELFDGWTGILIEPIPAIFARLVKSRRRTNRFVNCALVSDSYTFKDVQMLYSNLMSVAVGVKSDIRDPEAHARSGAKFLKEGEEVRLVEVPARTLTSILEEAGAPRRMGVLSLDVEGAELEALGGLDLAHYRFDFILIETRSFDKIAACLDGYGYSLHSMLTVHDYLFIDQWADDRADRVKAVRS